MAEVSSCCYGKSKVRVVKVVKSPNGWHDFSEITAQVLLEGDFDASFIKAENRLVVPTDTVKNTVYIVARKAEFKTIEEFALKLVEHFLGLYKHVTKVHVELVQGLWERLIVNGKPHEHSFSKKSNEKRWCKALGTRSGIVLHGGIKDLIVMKTTGSGFTNFYKCENTTLPDIDDRILATSVQCTWKYLNNKANFDAIYNGVKTTFIDIFSTTYSISVQATIWDAGSLCIQKFNDIDDISFVLPNLHHWPVDMKKFGLVDEGNIFVAVDEPHGDIRCVISRKKSKL